MSLDLAALIAQGFAIAPAPSGYDVTSPDGRHGHGATIEDAVLNIGAQIIPDADGRRQLHRANGDVIDLDAAGRVIEVPIETPTEVPTEAPAEVAESPDAVIDSEAE